MNIRKLGNSEKLKFPFWVEGPLVMIFGGVGVGGPNWGGVVGVGGAMAGSQMGQGVGTRIGRWQGREGMAGGRRARWQLLEVMGQEGGGAGGQMAGVVGQEADTREPDGAGAVGQGRPDGQEGGM